MAVLANALAFHDAIAREHDVSSLAVLRGPRSSLSKRRLLAQWSGVLPKVTGCPIFKLASDIIRPVGSRAAGQLLGALSRTVEQLAGVGLSGLHDIVGRTFQRLARDRKLLASFYTMPASAALLAELALSRLRVDWDDPEAYSGLRVADLACGSGTLLFAAYAGVRSRYRMTGRDDRELHRSMMEEQLVGADVMPVAACLAASQLAGAHPAEWFGGCRVYTMPYGAAPGGSVALGALELLRGPGLGLPPARSPWSSRSRERSALHPVDVPDGSLDLVIMNPPFTRPTNHKVSAAPVPSFAGLSVPPEVQRRMALSLVAARRALPRAVGNGYAGLASDFIDLAHAKVRPGGVVAFVLPMAFCQGRSWAPARRLFTGDYDDVAVVSTAADASAGKAFSADTGMGEVLLVARKRSAGASVSRVRRGGASYFNLERRPETPAGAAVLAGALRPPGPREPVSSALVVAGVSAGVRIQAGLADGGCAGVRDPRLALAAMALQRGSLGFGGSSGGAWALPVAPLHELGVTGKVHRLVGSRDTGSGFPARGPFRIVPWSSRGARYPVLWSHDAGRERCLVVRPDAEGEVREGLEGLALEVWKTRTRLHFSLDFRLNSQSLAACLTPRPCLGGRAWPSVRLHAAGHEALVVLWANTTLGLLAFWWAGSRQQAGRAVLTVSTLRDLVLVNSALVGRAALDRAGDVLLRFRRRRFRPASEAACDPVRAELDRAVLIDVLGQPPALLEPVAALRRAWSAEPTVHGGKG